MVLTEQKRNYLEKLSTKEGVISALAFDQRGALKRLMAQYQDTEPTVAQMEELKVLVAEELTPFASSMLLSMDFQRLRSWMQKQVSCWLMKKLATTLLAQNVCQTALTFGQLNASKNRAQMQ